MKISFVLCQSHFKLLQTRFHTPKGRRLSSISFELLPFNMDQHANNCAASHRKPFVNLLLIEAQGAKAEVPGSVSTISSASAKAVRQIAALAQASTAAPQEAKDRRGSLQAILSVFCFVLFFFGGLDGTKQLSQLGNLDGVVDWLPI